MEITMNKYNLAQCTIFPEAIEESSDNSSNNEIEIKVPVNTVNVVTGEKLRNIQSITLRETKEFLSKTFGPMGSNTKIIKGAQQSEISSSYSKDGLKVLSNIINSAPIEASIVDELVSVTRAVEKEVGDGTTSTVILSSLIFDRLTEIEKDWKVPPFQLCRLFQKVVDDIKEDILSRKRECTVDDIYNIAMISTNGNSIVSKNIADVYKQYGMDVELTAGISNSNDTVLKVYDGLTITEGMSDPVYINNKANNTAEIYNAHVYHFADPIDSMDMITLFETILKENIYIPMAGPNGAEDCIPTVITCPRLSKDMSSSLKMLANHLYQYNEQGAESAKPPILIITDVIASDEVIMDDIANLCGCKTIRKYIDPEVYKKDIESGVAPTVDNIAEFAGHAELVVADSKKTKFINPVHMIGENGEKDPIYTAMVNFLETEIEQAKGSENAGTVGLLKKRLSALKANMVDYLVGGVTIAERDMEKDLVEDAIKNCKSASLYGVGYAANFEGLASSLNVFTNYYNDINVSIIERTIAGIIFSAYTEIANILYSTVESNQSTVKEYILESLKNGKPYNISSGMLPKSGETTPEVLCSIMLDINILDTISKIITMMVTCNQCLLQSPNLNRY